MSERFDNPELASAVEEIFDNAVIPPSYHRRLEMLMGVKAPSPEESTETLTWDNLAETAKMKKILLFRSDLAASEAEAAKAEGKAHGETSYRDEQALELWHQTDIFFQFIESLPESTSVSDIYSLIDRHVKETLDPLVGNNNMAAVQERKAFWDILKVLGHFEGESALSDYYEDNNSFRDWYNSNGKISS